MEDDKVKKARSPKTSPIITEQQWAERVEKILRQWLLDQPYTTKLAFVLLNGCWLADDRTQAVYHEISEKYKAEVINAAEELPGTLVNIELLLTGIAADMLHAEQRKFDQIKSETRQKDLVVSEEGTSNKESRLSKGN